MPTPELQDFITKIMYFNTATPGMGSGYAGLTLGPAHTAIAGINPAAEAIADIKKHALLFASACQKDTTPAETLTTLAKEVEGALYVASTLSILDETQVEALTAELHDILENKLKSLPA